MHVNVNSTNVLVCISVFTGMVQHTINIQNEHKTMNTFITTNTHVYFQDVTVILPEWKEHCVNNAVEDGK